MAKPILIVDEEDIYFPTLFFPLGPIHTATTASSTMSIFDAGNGFYGNKWVCSHGHLCQRLLLQHGEVIFSRRCRRRTVWMDLYRFHKHFGGKTTFILPLYGYMINYFRSFANVWHIFPMKSHWFIHKQHTTAVFIRSWSQCVFTSFV